MEIVPEEAEVVTRIYAAYLSGQGYDSIASELNQSKPTAGREVWHSSAIHYILTNVTYTGDMIWQKTFAGNTIPFKTIRNKGQKPRYFAEACHEPIISKADVQKVQELIAARQKQFSGMQIVTDSVYQGHIFCGSCGAKCRRKPDREHVYWVCNRHDVKKSRCPVPQIPETEITAAVQRMCSKLKINAESILAPLLAQLKELRKRELRSNQKISDIDKELARLAEQNLVLTRLKSKGYIDSTLYFAQQDEINHKLLELKKLRRNIMALANEEGQIQATESMIEYLADAPEWMERIEPELFDSLVKEIRLVSAGEIRIKLYNGLELPETIKRMAR